jgi:hypothetical protein
MTKKEIIELYGKSVYQIRLDVATKLFAGDMPIPAALELADDFVRTLETEKLSELHEKF